MIKARRKRSDGSYYYFYILRDSIWDSEVKAQRQRYLGYVGVKPVLTEAKARALAKKLGCTVEEIKAVRRLRIVEE